MLPFIFALIFAVGLPLLPSSLHRALRLPTLKFNFLSARHEPERVLVSSPETALLLESDYSKVSPESGGSPQYLLFPDMASADCFNDAAAAPICMSLAEEQDFPQPSIWNVIHAQLLYQLAEATVIIALSFFATSTFLSRHFLSIFVERLCTALFISRYYSPKAALSSFLQDVFCGLHQYWMDDSVSKGETPKSVAKNPQRPALEVFANAILGEIWERDASVASLVSISNLQDNLDLVSLDKSSLSSGSSSSASVTLPHSTKVSSVMDPASTSLLDMSSRSLCSNTDISMQEPPRFRLGTCVERYPRCSTQPIITSETTDTNTEMPLQQRNHLSPSIETPGPYSDACFPVASTLPISPTASFPSMSMEDLYKSSRLTTPPTSLPEPPRREQEACVPESSPHHRSSCDHEILSDINSTTTDLEFPSESNSTSSLAMSQGSRRRYKSDGIQVLATRCHLGDTTSLLDPAKVDVTCAFWDGAPQVGERRVETLVKEASAPTRLPRSLITPRIRINKSEQGQNSLSAADAALAGLVVTAEGEMIVPASQRSDGSMRKEIRLRPGYAQRETFAEKYLPPAARRRTSTWNPLVREYSASSSSSPQRHDSPLPSTPRGFRQRPFGHQSNSPASRSDNWRRSNSVTANVTLPATVGKVAETESSPDAVEAPERNSPPEVSPQECSVPSETDVIPLSAITASAQATASAVNAPIQPADRLSFPPDTLDPSNEKEITSVEESAETTRTRKSADVADNDPDNLENQQPEVPSPTPNTSTAARREGRGPLRDITFTFSAPGPEATGECLALSPPRTVAAPTIFSQVSDIFSRDRLLKTPTRTNEDFDRAIRETALNSPRKRRPSAGSNIPAFQFKANDATLSTPVHPNRLPRARRSAPHLGKYAGRQQQGKVPRPAQTPDSSKRRRMRTASSRGVENWTITLPTATPMIDQSGQIVLPAGTGWKGRSLTAAGQIPQRQRQPTAVFA